MSQGVFFIECSLPFWVHVARVLGDQHGWAPVYWTGSMEIMPNVLSAFPNLVFHNNIAAVKGIPADRCKHLETAAVDRALRKQLAYCEVNALRMMDRMDPDGKFSARDRFRLFQTYAGYWTSVIGEFKPSLVLWPTSPHLVYDYVLYELCKVFGISTAMFRVTSVNGLIVPTKRFEDEPAQVQRYRELLVQPRPQNGLSEQTRCYVETIRADYDRAVPFYLKQKLDRASHSGFSLNWEKLRDIGSYPRNLSNMSRMITGSLRRRIRRFAAPAPINYLKVDGVPIERSHMTSLQYRRYKRNATNKKKRLEKYYESRTSAVKYRQPYIYVALHYQPERTTSPDGEVYVDQLLMVKALASVIPPDWVLYVKEHISQFREYSHGERSRTTQFYDDLTAIRSVRMVPLATSSFDLIDQARAVATVTGTCGWEAILRGTPALIFGHAWYRGCEGVFFGADEEECRRAVGQICSGYVIDKERVDLYLQALEAVGKRAYVASAYSHTMGITELENATTITESILSLVEREDVKC